ncbi:porin [Paraburkholderia sp. BL21I4N1]|uniref:porin n=1 Tax=Paraburkholderia sp. BL21I4N1 TaxID=1938801 RepID=UPI000CFB7534|nr:porin [Paraburkholderia sp. BL21I4N1]PQV50693.1 putative porin [Paraburkholderia sp. BL21I4N1]
MRNQTLRATLLAMGGLSLCTGAAQAQSSVTLYGIVDGGFTYTSNQGGKSNYQASAGSEQGSRWGLLGSEDLGGGNHAVFRLENGFNLMNGTASANGRIFGRQAWVGLSSDRFGTVTLGRQYNASQDFLEPLQLATDSVQYGTHPFDVDDVNNTFRTDNSIKYATPSFGGFQVNTMYALSGNPGNFATNRSYSIGAGFNRGPWHLGAAYVVLDHPATDTTGAIPSDNYFTFLKGISNQRIYGAGGLYDIGNASVGLMYTNTRFELTPASQYQTYQNAEASLHYRITPALHALIGETYTNVSTNGKVDSWHYWQTTTALQYFLSKSTDVYIDLLYQRATNAVAQIEGTSGPSSSGTQFLTVAGIRHKF